MATRLTTQLLDSLMTEELLGGEITQHFELKAKLYAWLFKGEGEATNPLGTKIRGYFTRPAGNGAISEGAKGVIPTAPEFAAMRARYTRMRHAMEYTFDALRVMQNAGKNGLALGLAKEMKMHTSSFIKQINRWLQGTGNGMLGIATAVSSTTVTFANTAALGFTHGSRWIEKNARYHFYDSSDAQVTSGGTEVVATCTSVDPPNQQATFDQLPSGLAAAISGGTTIIVKEGTFNKLPRGLNYHIVVSNTDYQTLLPNDYRDLYSTSLNQNDEAITVAATERLEKEMAYRADDDADLGEATWYSNGSQVEMLKLLGYSSKRWDGDAKTYDPTFKKVMIGDREVIEDVDAPKDKLRRLYQSQFHKLEFRPFGPIDEGNGVWNQPPGFNTTTGDGAFFERVRGNLGLDAELAGTRPGCQGELRRLDYANTATGEY